MAFGFGTPSPEVINVSRYMTLIDISNHIVRSSTDAIPFLRRTQPSQQANLR
jgi:hypothetical protein